MRSRLSVLQFWAILTLNRKGMRRSEGSAKRAIHPTHYDNFFFANVPEQNRTIDFNLKISYLQ